MNRICLLRPYDTTLNWNFYKDLLRLDSFNFRYKIMYREILNNFCYNYEKSDMC